MNVIITGADGALGAAVVSRFRRDKCRVATLVGSGQVDPAAGVFSAGDLADETNARSVIASAAAWLGEVDAVVHLAGGFTWREVASSSLADWRAMFDANVATAVATVSSALPFIVDGGAIVLVGANSAQPAGTGFGPYGAAKSAVARLTEALAAELRRRGIRVNAVLPAIIDTPRNRAEMPEADLSQWTSREAVADVIDFLASPPARAITGALVPVTNAA